MAAAHGRDVHGPAVGRVLTLAFLMVQLTVTGLRFMILGGADYRLWVPVGAMLAVTALFRHRDRERK